MRKLAILGGLVAAVTVLVVLPTTSASACGFFTGSTTVCPEGNRRGVDLNGTKNQSHDDQGSARSIGNLHQDAGAPPAILAPPFDDGCDFRCTDWTVNLPPDDEDNEDGAPAITIADVARFRPTVGIDRMEPNGWMVIDLPANFYATGGPSIERGELLDRNAVVRFTPARWRWDYGDGAQRTSGDPGSSWKTLGIDEFEPTGTSHVYDHAGTFAIQLTIFYTAEYRFDGFGWIPIAGVLPVPSNVIEARAVTAKTVLVAEDCTENPTGPGC